VCAGYLNIDKLFKKPYNPTDLTVIPYDEAHKFPRSLEDKHFEMLKEFVKNQFRQKNGSDEDFEVDYEKYDFRVKFTREE